MRKRADRFATRVANPHPTEITLIKASLKALTAVERVTSTIAAVFMFAIMMIVFTDVVMRYVFNRPFSWAYDLISLYIMAGVFFLSLSGTYAVNGHISVDILLPRFWPPSSASASSFEHGRALRSSFRSPGSAISARSTIMSPAT